MLSDCASRWSPLDAAGCRLSQRCARPWLRPSAAPATASDWLAGWRAADERAAEAILGVLAGEELGEPAVAAELGVLLPAEATLFVASSMPVRDIETFWPVRADPPRVLCNRGANGIDGTVSSAFGAAAAGEGPVVLLIGDVALAHDIGGLLAAKRLGLKLTIVLLDNDGGGIFDFLPVVDGAAMARNGEDAARRGCLHPPRRDAHGPGLRDSRRAVRPGYTSGRDDPRAARRPGARARAADRLDARARAHRSRRQRGAARPRVETRCRGRARSRRDDTGAQSDE